MTISVILMSSSAQTCSRCPLTPPSISPERHQHRADDHHAFHEDAEPGDLGGGQWGIALKMAADLLGRDPPNFLHDLTIALVSHRDAPILPIDREHEISSASVREVQ